MKFAECYSQLTLYQKWNYFEPNLGKFRSNVKKRKKHGPSPVGYQAVQFLKKGKCLIFTAYWGKNGKILKQST
jgi:hypothetical protein